MGIILSVINLDTLYFQILCSIVYYTIDICKILLYFIKINT